jgi:hypothetical protein
VPEQVIAPGLPSYSQMTRRAGNRHEQFLSIQAACAAFF